MQAVDAQRYQAALAQAAFKPRTVRDLRPKFGEIADWEDRELIAITDRSGNRGLLWIELDSEVYLLPYTLNRGIIDKATGRARPVICDLCCTQQLGTSAARISIETSPESTRSLLCCGDLPVATMCAARPSPACGPRHNYVKASRPKGASSGCDPGWANLYNR